MLDRENLLKVAEAVLAADQANERVSVAQQKLEAARAAVEAIRAEIAEAKEGVTVAKADLENTVAVFEKSGVSKTNIIKAAEELNRVFGDIGLFQGPVEQEEAEPEFSRASFKKLVGEIQEQFETYGVGDLNKTEFQSMEVEKLAVDVIAILSAGLGLAAKGTSKALTKDADGATGKRKRRVKAEIAQETQAEQPTADVEQVQVPEGPQVVETVNEEPAVGVSATAVDVQVTPAADVVTVVTEPSAVDETQVVTVVEDGELLAETVAETQNAPLDAIYAIDNTQVRDEIVELIDTNVADDDLNSILSTVAYAVFLKAEAEKTELSLYTYLDLMTINLVREASAADYAAIIAPDLDTLVADPDYVVAVLDWFRRGVDLIEDGKNFPAFEGVGGTDAATIVDDTPAEVASEVAEDEVFVASEELPEEVQAVDSIADVDVLSEVTPESVPTELPSTVSEVPTEVAPTEPVKFAPPPFMKPGFMKK